MALHSLQLGSVRSLTNRAHAQRHTCEEDLDHGLKILQHKPDAEAHKAFCKIQKRGKELIVLLANKVHIVGR